MALKGRGKSCSERSILTSMGKENLLPLHLIRSSDPPSAGLLENIGNELARTSMCKPIAIDAVGFLENIGNELAC